MEEKLDPIYAKHLVVCAKVNEIWCDPYLIGTDCWQESRQNREQTAWIISEYLEEEMRKYRQLWNDANPVNYKNHIAARSGDYITLGDMSIWQPVTTARHPWYKLLFKNIFAVKNK